MGADIQTEPIACVCGPLVASEYATGNMHGGVGGILIIISKFNRVWAIEPVICSPIIRREISQRSNYSTRCIQ